MKRQVFSLTGNIPNYLVSSLAVPPDLSVQQAILAYSWTRWNERPTIVQTLAKGLLEILIMVVILEQTQEQTQIPTLVLI